jgi:hypothetical protein
MVAMDFDPGLSEAARATLRREARGAVRETSAARAGSQVETIVSMVTLGGIVYVATTANVYRVDGDRLVRLAWPRGPVRRRKMRE